MSQEPEDYVSIETYSDLDRAAYDKEMLDGAGLHPALHEEASADSEHGYVLVMAVPSGEAEQAQQLLDEYWATEEQDEFKMFEEWKRLRERA
jgi:hypothetical protein